MFVLRFCLVFLIFIGFSTCQICKPSGNWCSDTELCCGGCCVNNYCIETYQDCRHLENPCWEHYCPEGSSCFVFKPSKCTQCELQAECRFIDYDGLNNIRGEFPQPVASAAYFKRLKLEYNLLILIIIKMCF